MQLDILVNNAGRSQRANWEKIDLDVDKELFQLNVFSVIALTRLVYQYFMVNNGKGHIVVTSSLAGLLGIPFSGSYTGSKHAIHVGFFDPSIKQIFILFVLINFVFFFFFPGLL